MLGVPYTLNIRQAMVQSMVEYKPAKSGSMLLDFFDGWGKETFPESRVIRLFQSRIGSRTGTTDTST